MSSQLSCSIEPKTYSRRPDGQYSASAVVARFNDECD